MTATDPQAAQFVPIRAVAEASGISAATLRAWERRYGRPVPVRLPSGHRRYTPDQVRWLRRVAEALAGGKRPSEVVPATDAQLDALLERPAEPSGRGTPLAELMQAIRGFESVPLHSLLERAAATTSPADFLGEVVAPLLRAVGQEWADGKLDVRHEHFASGTVDSVLRSVRDRLPEVAPGRPLVLATLPDEMHSLPLRMVDLLARAHGLPVAFLGANTPIDEIDATARETGAAGVLLSITAATAGVSTDRVLVTLRERLPSALHLLVGGAAARRGRRGPRGLTYLDSFHTLDRWFVAHREEFRS